MEDIFTSVQVNENIMKIYQMLKQMIAGERFVIFFMIRVRKLMLWEGKGGKKLLMLNKKTEINKEGNAATEK